jgi:hypothetical protein
MTHQFDTEHAEKYGVIPAIILQNIIWWIAKNKANEKHFHDGRYWTYNSVRAMCELFPYLTPKQIRSAIECLRDEGILITGNFSENRSDRSTWYALVNDDYLPKKAIHLPKKAKPFAQEGKSSISTDNKPDVVSVANAPDATENVFDDAGIQKRKFEFQDAIRPYVTKYGKAMCNSFYKYWSETTKSGKKMRWELEKTWEVAKRLEFWHRRDEEKMLRMQRSTTPPTNPTVASSPESYHTNPR